MFKTTNLNYAFDNNSGDITGVSVGISATDQINYGNGTFSITNDDLPQGQTFDDLSKKDFQKIAVAKFVKLINDASETPKLANEE